MLNSLNEFILCPLRESFPEGIQVTPHTQSVTKSC